MSTVIHHFKLSDSLTVRYHRNHLSPVLSCHRSRYGDLVNIFVGGDEASAWISVTRGRHTETAQLPDVTMVAIADEARRRHPHGLAQPHWARVACEWLYRGEIDMERLTGNTATRIADAITAP